MLVETKIDFLVLIALIFHIDLIKRFKQFMNRLLPATFWTLWGWQKILIRRS